MSNSIGNLKNSGLKGNNWPWQYKMLQGLQAIHDEVKSPLTCVEDSIALCAGGNLLTSTTIGADIGLDVNIIGGVTLVVNLDAADDEVGVYGYVNGASGSPVPLNVNATGQVAIQDGGNSITVDSNAVVRVPNIARPIHPTTGIAGPLLYSVSFANVGTGNAEIDGIILKPGEIINFDAGGINNTLASISYDLVDPGAELLITGLA